MHNTDAMRSSSGAGRNDEGVVGLIEPGGERGRPAAAHAVDHVVDAIGILALFTMPARVSTRAESTSSRTASRMPFST